MNALEVKGLSRSFKNFELKDVSFVLPEGCIMGLVGENGAGKSTTIKLILNMLKKDGGEIKLFEKDYEDSVKEDIGTVLDDLGLPDCLDVKKTDKVMNGIYQNWDSNVYFDLCQRLRIPQDKTVKEFSKGNRAKLAIVIALSHKAKLLLLDEPTSGLDPLVRDEILDILNDFTREDDHSILISSHIVSDLEKLCDYIVFIHDGKIILCKEKDELVNEYGTVHLSIADFEKIDRKYVLHYEKNPYGVKAIVKREAGKYDFERVDIEELFVAMIKELNR
ncbi:MAG: ABC transporter ATP-binding protein [Erysipelotrichaceae bacterium]